MSPDTAALTVIVELRQRVDQLETENAALRQHLADHPANQPEPTTE